MTKRILVADDDPAVLELVAVTLTQAGYSVDCVDDGLAALHKAKEVTYDVAILDVMMPHIEGYHLAYKLSTELDGPSPKVIILSSRDERQDDYLGVKSGAKVQLKKPINTEELLAKVRELLN